MKCVSSNFWPRPEEKRLSVGFQVFLSFAVQGQKPVLGGREREGGSETIKRKDSGEDSVSVY